MDHPVAHQEIFHPLEEIRPILKMVQLESHRRQMTFSDFRAKHSETSFFFKKHAVVTLGKMGTLKSDETANKLD
jgi:hypothetical protein